LPTELMGQLNQSDKDSLIKTVRAQLSQVGKNLTSVKQLGALEGLRHELEAYEYRVANNEL
jgi:hypothetical protein